jgi:tRNA (guanine-N7-)-methyltransferase
MRWLGLGVRGADKSWRLVVGCGRGRVGWVWGKAVRHDGVMSAHPLIRSFKGRTGRMASKQLASWSAGERSIMLPQSPWKLSPPTVLDIGSGMGDAALSLAASRPETTVVGIDVFRRGLANTMHAAMSADLQNLRVYEGDCMAALTDLIPLKTVSEILVWFPDPWPKRNQRKRRLIGPSFLAAATRVLAQDGVLRIATDWSDYADWIEREVRAAPNFVGGRCVRPDWRPITKFEGKGHAAGRDITDLSFRLSG